MTGFMTDDEIADAAIAGMETDRGGPDSWVPVDLGPYLRGEVERPEPTVGISRSDGIHLLYRGREHAVIGEMESGKTWFAAACVANELAWGRHVLYLHFEEADPYDLVGRLRALGTTDVAMLKLLRFVAPARPVSITDLALLLDPPPSLVTFDGVNEAMALHRWGIREEDGAAAFRRQLVMPCLRVGAATLSCDHVVKDMERRGRYALGSIHKGNGLSGSLVLLENESPFGRGQRGASFVYVTKDRPGHLRQYGQPTKVPGKTFMGVLAVDDSQTYTPDLEVRFWAPTSRPATDESADPQAEARQAAKEQADVEVLAVVAALRDANAPAGLNAVVARSPYGKGKTSESLVRLVLDKKLTETREGQQRVFDLVP